MIRRTAAAIAFVFATAVAAPVFAQGSYVGAFLVGDIVRLDQYDSTVRDSGNGEAFGFGLRLGTPVGTKWGVELEFVRPGEITSEQTPQILPASIDLSFTVLPNVPSLPNVGGYDPLTFPSYSYTFRTTQRRTTLSTSLWVRQEITPRFSLIYLGGVAFGRTNNEIEISYLPVRILPIPRIAPTVNESINYTVGPMVGVEGRIRMGGQVDFVPSLRMHGIDGGWMVRPALGLNWNF